MSPLRPVLAAGLVLLAAGPALASPPGWYRIGPCLLITPEYSPSNGSSLTCVVEGTEVAYANAGPNWVGYHCYARVAGVPVADCPPGFPWALLP